MTTKWATLVRYRTTGACGPRCFSILRRSEESALSPTIGCSATSLQANAVRPARMPPAWPITTREPSPRGSIWRPQPADHRSPGPS